MKKILSVLVFALCSVYGLAAVTIKQQDRMIYSVVNTEVNVAKIIAEVSPANQIQVTLSGEQASEFSISAGAQSIVGANTPLMVNAYNGIAELYVTYIGEKSESAIGKIVTITIDGQSTTLTIEKPNVVSFLPTDGMTSYSVQHTDGSGITYTVGENDAYALDVEINKESLAYIKLSLNQTEKTINGYKYVFFGWLKGDGTYLSFDRNFTGVFEEDMTIVPEFIPAEWARYVIKSDLNTQYYDLNKAIQKAQMGINSEDKIIVVHKDGVLPKGDYTIPSGVTLLVPGEETYKCVTAALTKDDYIVETYSAAKNECYRKLTVEDGTNIVVESGGNICIYAKMLIDTQIILSFPYQYGHIELGHNAKVDLKSGANLYAWGYITNPDGTKVDENNVDKVGRVNAQAGSTVWESFQFYDFRGGTKTVPFTPIDIPILMPNKGYKRQIFPINQYYIQNVEVPLKFANNSTEMLVTGISANGTTTTTSTEFIASNKGLFKWNNVVSASIIKYYDANTDRLKFIITDTQQSTPSVILSNISLKLSLGIKIGDIDISTVTLNSNDYVLPINGNMDVSLKSAHVQIPNGVNIALLAGSVMWIDKDSKLTNNAQIYVYDKDQNISPDGGGYFGSTDAQLLTIKNRPYGIKKVRTVNEIQDAAVIIDGIVDNTNGYFITTIGGAKVTSNGGGQISIENFGKKYSSFLGSLSSRNQSAFQYSQAGTEEFFEVSLSTTTNSKFTAKLQHSNGEYLNVEYAVTYYYCDGIWGTTACSGDGGYYAPTPVNYMPLFNASVPGITAYVEEGLSVNTINITEVNTTNAPSASRSYSAKFTGPNANLFTFNSSDKTITFNPASAGVKSAVMILTATYTLDGVDYVHSQAIKIKAEAKNQIANTLAFADFASLYKGQQNVSLWTNKNSEGKITIQVINNDDVISNPTADGVFNALNEGNVTITISQEAANHIAATTITTTFAVKPRVVWNWSRLYYPSVNTAPITVLDGSSNWTLEEIIVPSSGDVVKFEGNGPIGTNADTYRAEIFDLINGEYEVEFRFTQPDYSEIIFTSNIYRDPRYVRIDVNDDRVFEAVTVGAAEGITFNELSNTVAIQSAQQPNAWTMHFLGVPDKLYFTPSGNNAWQIEESSDGIVWTTTVSWTYLAAGKNVEYSLLPSTQYVRISYGANGEGVLKDVYITKLDGVKFMPEKLYIPAVASAKKNVTITYVSDKDVTITDPSGEFVASPTPLAKTITAPFYNVQDVMITNNGCTEQKLSGVNVTASVGTEILPIQSYIYPQELPIVLSSDMPAERFYYVTTNMYNTTWNNDTRTISMHNAVAEAQPFVTFYFEGVPSYISFSHTGNIKGDWIITESSDGVTWTAPTAAPVITNTSIKQNVSNTSKYIRVTYSGLYAEKVEITDLMIIGEEGAFAQPAEMTVEYVAENNNFKDFSVTAINLANGMTISTDNDAFTLTHGTNGVATAARSFTLSATEYPDVFSENIMKALAFKVYFDGGKAIDYATITITNVPADGEITKELTKIKVTGVRKSLTSGEINIYTGVPDGKDGKVAYNLQGSFTGSDYHKVDISNAFANGSALFDYLYIFGETTTTDATTTIKTPTTLAGSNAKTPCYIYKKNGNAYDFYGMVENTNASSKVTQDFLQLTDANPETIKVYITGFCPYASTGYTKRDEGVFFFQGGADDHVHVYLEDCYLYSRSKTENGHYFENRSDGQSFTEGYVKGSGGVLVFECVEDENPTNPFNVTIHTRGRNMFKSHYGCFLESVAGRAFQVSSPVQIHMQSDEFINASYTTLTFDDKWPNSATGLEERTNGFLSLQKQVNNAPSIDLGNKNTVVNFCGGRIELQNAQNVSDNYESTLAISQREGTFAGFRLAYGLGSDGVGGTVNFIDGTTTVLTMEVAERYRQYYLMDTDENGNELATTSCLRCPQNTYVTGGSHCMMRACSAPTSQGGAPTSGPSGEALGLYKYPKTPESGHKGGWDEGENGLVNPTDAPDGYNVNSVTPNNNGTDEENDDFLNFWVPAGYDDSVVPEIDKKISFWKACMTEIAANYAGYGGVIGGDTEISMNDSVQTEVVTNMLYCTIDQNIHEVIQGKSYAAPVKSPLPSGDEYLYIAPTSVGEQTQHYIANEKDYQIENKIYYITTATADTWLSFTAPFDVENIYIMETYSEKELEAYSLRDWDENNPRQETLKEQARHNANFAAFFGVAMVIHPNKTFDMIYNEYIKWADSQDIEAGKYPLIPYDGTNWDKANSYIYHNTANWGLTWNEYEDDGEVFSDPMYETYWEFLTKDDTKPMMQQGESYSILLPYCVGCDNSEQERTEWDYWSGKFLIFESTAGPHTLKGGEYVGTTINTKENDPDYADTKGKYVYTYNYNTEPSNGDWVLNQVPELDTEAALTGNYTFAEMQTDNVQVFAYDATMNAEYFYPTAGLTRINPTTAFLLGNPPIDMFGMPARSISRTGQIDYGKVPSGLENGNVPTISGGNDIFVTSIADGINIAVAAPQLVKVMSSSGVLLFNGWVTDSVDVNIPSNGIYVVAGENTALKVLY